MKKNGLKYAFVAGAMMFVSACETASDVVDKTIDTTTDIYGDVKDGIGRVSSALIDSFVADVGDRVFFATDSYRLDSQAQAVLQAQARWLEQKSDVRIIVEGHADERGTREYNLALGERRANSIRNYLVNLGVSPSRIATISYGKERPAVLGDSPSAWAQNRRGVTVLSR